MERDSRVGLLDALLAVLVDDNRTVQAWSATADPLIGPAADMPEALEGLRIDSPERDGTGIVRVSLPGTEGRTVSLDAFLLPLHHHRAEPRTGAGGVQGLQPPHQLLLALPPEDAARLQQEVAFVRELFRQNRVGVAVFDTDLRLVRTNTHLLPYTGVPLDLAGRRLHEFLHPQDAQAVDTMLRSALRTGRPEVTSPLILRTLIDPRGGTAMSLSTFRLQDAHGEVLGVAGLFTDITGEFRARRRLGLLHDVTAATGGTLSVTGVAEELVQALVRQFADAAAVDIAPAAISGQEIRPDPDGGLELRRAAWTGTAAAPTEQRLRAGADEPDAVSHGGPGARLHSMEAVLRARGRLLGRVTVHRDRSMDEYEPEDRVLLQEIAGRAALALDNAYRYTYEHRTAVALQRSLLPSAARSVPAATTASVYLPADSGDVGGDWFDVIPLSSTRVALVVGDVTGHGLHASATMARVRTAVRTLADLDLEPDELLVHLDDLVSQLLTENEFTDAESAGLDPQAGPGDGSPEPGLFVGTCLYAVHDPIARTCVLASAGHPPPALLHPDGRTEFLPVTPGPPLGVGGLPFEALRVDIEPGSVLALYTDGLIERGDGDIDTGLGELLRRLSTVGAGEQELGEAARRIVTGLPPTRLDDDVTLLLARTKAVPDDDIALWTVEADPQSVSEVRAKAAACLAGWGLEALGFTTELLLSELVTNAIRYGQPPITVRLIRATTLTCEVSDGSSSQPRMRRARLTDEGGRGLFLVAQLASRWGSRYTARGKTIWTEQPLPPD